MNIASRIDHTLLRPTCTEKDIAKLCEEAIHYKFYSVCIPPVYLNTAKNLIVHTSIKLCTVIGFPLGFDTTNTKVTGGGEALNAGAHEIDMVVNLSAFKSGNTKLVHSEIEKLANLCHQENAILKVIIETAYLDKEEIKELAKIGADGGADFIKTSTGFAGKGATIEDVILLRQTLPPGIKIKASGGIKTYSDALNLVQSGADRLGTSSGVNIVNREETMPGEMGRDKNY